MSDFAYPFSLNLDGSGNGSIDLTPFFVPTYYQVMNIGANVPGSGTQVMQVLLNGTPYQQANGSSPQLGPIYLHSQKLTLVVTGGTANGVVQGYVQGAEEQSYGDLPNLSGPATNNVSINGGTVTLGGPVTISGPVTVEQPNPSSLISAALGVPLIENQSFQVLANSFVSFGTALGFDISGYGGLVLFGAPNVATAAFHAQLLWMDDNGNTIGFTEIPDLRSSFTVAYNTLGTHVEIYVWNVSGVNHGINNFTVIPVVNMPNTNAGFLSDVGGVVSNNVGNDPRIILNGSSSVPASGSVTMDATTVYNGPCIWYLSNHTGLTANTLWAELNGLDASGGVWPIAKQGGVAMQQPCQVALPALHTQVIVHNTGTGAVNADCMLVAI